MTAITFWAAKNFSIDWHELVMDVPLGLLFLWARQDQYNQNDKVMTLGDKELIDELELRQGGNVNGNK